MDPFGNFGWDFGFGFGWLLVGIFTFLLVLAVVQLARLSSNEKSEEQAAFDAIKPEVCSNRISFDKIEDKIKNRV